MKCDRRLFLAALLTASGCNRLDDILVGLSAFTEVASLVDSVSFLPTDAGRRNMDPGEATLLSPGVEAIEIVFVEALDAESAGGFTPEQNLEFVGVSPDPFRPAFLNESPIGKRRRFQVLTIPLATPLPAGGPFFVRLRSSEDGNLLRTVGQATPFVGTFDIAFEVRSRDGAPPFVERLVSSVGAVEQISVDDFSNGPIEIGFVAPHSPLQIEFSEEMRGGIPVLLSPSVPVEEERTIGTRTFRFFRPTVPGLSLEETVVEDANGARRSVLTTPAGQVRPIDVQFDLRIPSGTSLAPQATLATDLSGEPLVARLPNSIGLASDYWVRVNTAAVVILSPSPDAILNAADLGDLTVPVSGFVSPAGGTVLVAVLSPDGAEQVVEGAELTGVEVNSPYGVPMRQWTAAIPSSALSSMDGPYTLSAFTFARGSDSIGVEVDTTGPLLFDPTGNFDLYANAADSLDEVCVALGRVGPGGIGGGHGADADRAELVLPDGTVLDAADTELFENDEGDTRLGFCWRDVAVGGQLPIVGRANLVVRVFDLVGNVSTLTIEVRVHPWLDSVTPDVVQVVPGFSNEVVLHGVGLKTFSGADGDAVRVDGRDQGTGTVRIDGVLGGPIAFVIEADLPATISPGAIAVRIDGLESNRLRFEVCRPEPPKFVTERPFANFREDVIEALDISRSEFAMERGLQGEPVFAWADEGSLVIAAPDASGRFVQSTVDAPSLRHGDLVEFWRASDGTLVPIWISTGSGAQIETDGKYGSVALPLAGKPEWLAVDTDPSTGLPMVLVVTRRPSPAGGLQAWAQLFRMSEFGPSQELSERIDFQGEGSFSGGIAIAPDGRGWLLVGADQTYQWRRETAGTWTRLDATLPGFVSDVILGPDQKFHAVVYGDGSSGIAKDSIPAPLRYYRASPSESSWTLEWTHEMEARPSAFRPPPIKERPEDPARLLAAAATVRVTADGIPVIAYMDVGLKSVRLQRLLPLDGDIGMLPLPDFDVDVATGHMIELVLDGNGAALVSYADLSMAQAPPDPDDLDPGEAVEERLSSSILLTDTRTNVQPRPGVHRGPSRCSDRYDSEYISAANLDEIGRRQADRWQFRFFDFVDAFCVPPLIGPGLSARAQRLCELQGTAALSSRLLDQGTFTFRGGLPDLPGDPVDGTVDASREPRPDENLGLRVPIGYHAYASAQIETGDEELSEFHLANFEAVERASPCDGKNEQVEGEEAQPVARVGAAMAYAPSRRKMVLFGGRNEAGNNLRDTWTLETGEQCWERADNTGAPPAQGGHVMVTAPQGEGVLFFGTGGTFLFDLKSSENGAWVQLPTIGAPPAQAGASAAFDLETQKVWLLADDLWSFEAVPNGSAFNYVWMLEDFGPPTNGTGASIRTRAGLLLAPKLLGGAPEFLYAFGGRADGDLRNDLWRRPLSGGGTWTNVSSHDVIADHISASGDVVPEAREGMSAVYAPSWGRLVFYGGATLAKGFQTVPRIRGGNTMDALGVSNDAEWEFIQRVALPVPRRDHAWALDTSAGSERLVLFGGRNGAEFLDDTDSFAFVQTEFGIPSGTWESLIPPSKDHTGGIAFGRRNDDVDVQWGRNDIGAIFDSPGASGLLEGFVGGAFPPLGNSSAAAIRFRFDHYRLGGGRFTRFLDPVDGASGEQGSLRNRFRLSRVFAEGDIIVAGDNFVATIDVTNDIPLLPHLPLAGCTLLLNAPPAQFPDFFIEDEDVVIDADVQLALDDRGPTADELSDFPDLADQTHTKFSGVVVSENVDVEVPLCVRVKVGGVPLSSSELLTLVGGTQAAFAGALEAVLISTLTRQLGLDRVGVDIDTPDGVLGSLGPLAGARAVDAFTYIDGQDPQRDLRDLRTGGFIAVRRGVSQIQEPQWILLEDGLTLSVRTDGVLLPPL